MSHRSGGWCARSHRAVYLDVIAVCVCACVCVRACVRACERVCVHACVRACVYVHVQVFEDSVQAVWPPVRLSVVSMTR